MARLEENPKKPRRKRLKTLMSKKIGSGKNKDSVRETRDDLQNKKIAMETRRAD